MPLADVIAELNVALRQCREHILERRNDTEALDKLHEGMGKIQLALNLLTQSTIRDPKPPECSSRRS